MRTAILLVVVVLALAPAAGATPRQDLVTGTLTYESGKGVLPMPRQLQAAEAAACPSATLPYYVRAVYTSRAGFMLWRYSQQVDVCFTGDKITSFFRWRWFEIPSLVPGFGFSPWSFEGNIDNSCETEHCVWTGSAGSKFAMTRGHFRACGVPLVSWFCTDKYPLLTLTVYSNRLYDSSVRDS